MERRLVAILAADVVGYSRLMGEDEAGTLRRLTELRQQVLEPLIAKHKGRVVKLMGDGLLIEFSSVVDAATCAVAWQNQVAEEEAAANDANRLRFRIGINLGDVIVEGENFHGDAVNIAARLEGLAHPGGICLSADAYRQVRGKIEAEFEDLGELNIKNVAEPVRVFRVQFNGAVPAATTTAAAQPPSRGRWQAIATGLLLSLIAIPVLIWLAPWVPHEEPASAEAMTFPLPDKPSILVLPLSGLWCSFPGRYTNELSLIMR